MKGEPMLKKWTKKDLVALFEILIERNSPIVSHPQFRQHLTRNENLFTNQTIREANGSIAYRSVDFKVDDELSDEAFWERIEKTPYTDLIEDNAAVAIVKMAEKLKLLA